MFTNRPEEVLLLDTLVKRFIYWPHPPLNPYPYRSRFVCGEILSVWIALDAPEGGVAFFYFHAAQVFARRERNWGGVITRLMDAKITLIDSDCLRGLERNSLRNNYTDVKSVNETCSLRKSKSGGVWWHTSHKCCRKKTALTPRTYTSWFLFIAWRKGLA